MKNTLLVRRYAKAFLDFAIQNNMAEQGLADLEVISNTLQENRELRSILSQPFVLKSRKKNIVTKVFGEYVSKTTLRFIMLMLDRNRHEIIQLIYPVYRELYNEYKNIALVTITTPIAIDEPTQRRLLYFIKDKLNGEIQIINKTDRSIIGGFIINYLDYQYDRSVRSELKNLRNLFTDNLYVKGY